MIYPGSFLNKNFDTFLFAIILGVLFFITGNLFVLNLDPSGIHFIRQTDSLAFASNYYNFNYSLFSPHVYNLASTEGKAACEFPLIYYLTAKIYLLTGESFWVLRTINFLLSFGGVISLFQFAKRVIDDIILAIVVTLIAVTSTVFLYYATNFLVDTSALGLSFIGLNAYHSFTVTGDKRRLYLAFFAFVLAGLFKMTFCILPTSLLLAQAATVLIDTKNLRNIFKKLKTELTLFIIMVCVIFSWYMFAIEYNRANHDHYFLTHLVPIWNLSESELHQTIEAITFYWKSSYYYEETRYSISIAILINILFWRRTNVFFKSLFIFGALGAAAYIILFFGQFKDHDYYMLPVLPFISFMLVLAASHVKTSNKKLLTIFIKISLVAILAGAIFYCQNKLTKRFENTTGNFQQPSKIFASAINTLQDFPNSNEPIVIIGDTTRNGSLLFLKRRGYIFHSEEDVVRSNDREKILASCEFILALQEIEDTLIRKEFIQLRTNSNCFIYRNKHQ